MFCKYCGTRLDDVQKFCGICGRAVDRNIRFADPTAKRIDAVEQPVAEPVTEPVTDLTAETEIEETVAEPAEPVAAVAEDEHAETEQGTEPEPVEEVPVKLTGLKVGLLVWTIINMAFGMYPLAIPALIMNIRAARRPEESTQRTVSFIKVLNFTATLLLALVLFYGTYMTMKYSPLWQ